MFYMLCEADIVLGNQICVLDEPSNFLDREALGGLAVAIRDWAGAVVRFGPLAPPPKCDADRHYRSLFLTTRNSSPPSVRPFVRADSMYH